MTEALATPVSLSPNTKAILLLTAPLITGRGKKSTELLTPTEYRKLARHLRALKAQPADLISPTSSLLNDCRPLLDKARLERLLARGFLLSQALERWQSRAIWVISRADPEYPKRLKTRLRENSPAVLYGCGDWKILNSGGLAVVGSRHVDDGLIHHTQEIGRLVAAAGRTVVSGGARGIDQAAMHGASSAGGRVTGVLADSLEKRALQRENRNFLMSGRLVLISPFDPSAGFNVGHAMQRNKLIYALSDAALVMSATVNKGGTWAGAIEQLEKLYLVPIFVRAVGESAGLDALVERGALPWPDPADAEALNTVLTTPNRTPVAAPNQGLLAFGPRHEKTDKLAVMPPTRQGRAEPSLADELRRTVYSLICQLVREPMKADEVADRLDVTRSQAERWLLRLVEEGVLQKTKKPVRYSFHRSRLPKTKSPEGEGINSRKGTEERVPPH